MDRLYCIVEIALGPWSIVVVLWLLCSWCGRVYFGNSRRQIATAWTPLVAIVGASVHGLRVGASRLAAASSVLLVGRPPFFMCVSEASPQLKNALLAYPHTHVAPSLIVWGVGIC